MKNFTLLGILFAVFCTHLMAQETPNDCVDALEFNANELSGQTFNVSSGVGDISEVVACGSVEHNSLWLKVTMTGTGNFGFNLVPLDTDLSVDYDFWVYEEGNGCGDLGPALRCNTINPIQAGLTYNVTGINGSTTTITQGPGANGDSGYVYWLNVQQGEVYFIIIDGPEPGSGNVGTGRMDGPSGFTLEPLGSAVTLGVEEQLLGERSINIYPNPAKGEFTIDCSAAANVSGWSVEVVNMLGQIVYSNTMDSQQLTVAAPQLNTQGMYFVKVSDQFNNVVSVKRLVVK